jgi:hypothetical protein
MLVWPAALYLFHLALCTLGCAQEPHCRPLSYRPFVLSCAFLTFVLEAFIVIEGDSLRGVPELVIANQMVIHQ